MTDIEPDIEAEIKGRLADIRVSEAIGHQMFHFVLQDFTEEGLEKRGQAIQDHLAVALLKEMRRPATDINFNPFFPYRNFEPASDTTPARAIFDFVLHYDDFVNGDEIVAALKRQFSDFREDVMDQIPPAPPPSDTIVQRGIRSALARVWTHNMTQ